MTKDIDATSRFQQSLPVTSDEIIAKLDNWGIDYSRADHVPLRTVEESKKVQDKFLSIEQGGGHIKNLYLRDTKKRNILVVAEQDRLIDHAITARCILLRQCLLPSLAIEFL